VVRLAMKKKTGARALRSILEEAMLDIMFELPSKDDVCGCVISEGAILKKIAPACEYRKKEKKRARA
jgi:ATP-dependent Clp protease ATP-binding subunit ClpX